MVGAFYQVLPCLFLNHPGGAKCSGHNAALSPPWDYSKEQSGASPIISSEDIWSWAWVRVPGIILLPGRIFLHKLPLIGWYMEGS